MAAGWWARDSLEGVSAHLPRVRNPLFARIYVRMTQGEDPEAIAHRKEMLAGLAGRVIEVGCGNGGNFPHYPSTVTEVVAVEPEPYLRTHAERAAADAAVPVRVVDGVAEQLPAGDGELDAVVSSLVLCSVADQQRVLAEMRRVLRPGGELRFYEHVAAHEPRLARIQRLFDRTFWPHVSGNCHTHRDTGAAIEQAGFEMERQRRVRFSPCAIAFVVAPHIVGVARRP